MNGILKAEWLDMEECTDFVTESGMQILPLTDTGYSF
jgi:hypothetical protein